MGILDPIESGSQAQEESTAAGGVSRFAVMAGLAINLAGMMPSSAQAQENQPADLNATERFVQIWGDCIDE